MNKILSSPILKLIGMILLIPALLVNVFTAYILFAPNTFPKPFQLVYEYPEAAAPAGEHSEGGGSHTNGEVAPQPAVSEPQSGHTGGVEQGIMFDTGTKIINLAEPSGRRYIRVNIVLEIYPSNPDYVNLEHEAQNHYLEEFNQEIEDSLPIINDSLISELSSKTFEEVYTAEGKEKIREEIVTLLNEKLADHHIMNVYFTEFVVQ
mgnify:CR=1 FL=1